MNFQDRGIIIDKKPLKEQSYILTVFTEKHGIYSGVLRQYSKKSGDSITPGNLVDFFWNARLHEHIGSAKAELVKSYGAQVMMNKTKLYAFNSIVSLLQIAFIEREPHVNLFPKLLEFMEMLRSKFCFKVYINLELAILAESGHRLQLDRCAVTESADDLYYVSPKSGRAVSREAGAEYADKLLKLPDFLVDGAVPDDSGIREVFALTSYFFDRYLLINKPNPIQRASFMEHMLEKG